MEEERLALRVSAARSLQARVLRGRMRDEFVDRKGAACRSTVVVNMI